MFSFDFLIEKKPTTDGEKFLEDSYKINFGTDLEERFSKEIEQFCFTHNLNKGFLLNYCEVKNNCGNLSNLKLNINFEEAKRFNFFKNKNSVVIILSEKIFEELLTINISKNLNTECFTIIFKINKEKFLQKLQESDEEFKIK